MLPGSYDEMIGVARCQHIVREKRAVVGTSVPPHRLDVSLRKRRRRGR